MRRRQTSLEAVREALRRGGQQSCTRGEIRIQTGFARQTVSDSVARLMRQGEAYRRTPRGRILLRSPNEGRVGTGSPPNRFQTRPLRPADQRVVDGLAKLLGWMAEHNKEAWGFSVGVRTCSLTTLLAQVIRGYRSVRSQG